MRGVSERCFFDRRRGFSSGRRGSRASLQQYQFGMQDKQLYTKFKKQQNRQYADRSWCRILPQNINERDVNVVCDRQRRQKEKRRATLGCKKPLKATTSHSESLKSHSEPLKSHASHFSKKKKKRDPLSAFRHWPGPGQAVRSLIP